MLVEPVDGVLVLFASILDDPDEHFSLLTSAIGEDLAEVVVVGLLELVLDDNNALFGINCKDIRLVGTNIHFGAYHRQRPSSENHFGELIDVFR